MKWHASLNALKLAYPPMTNRHATHLSENGDFREYVDNSKFYTLAHRECLRFNNFRFEYPYLVFDLEQKSQDTKDIVFNLDQLQIPDGAKLELGEQMIYYHQEPHPIFFTPDKLLFDHWRGHITVEGLDDFQKFTKFELYYVGISKDQDSATRLFSSGHHALQKILSLEEQKDHNSTLSDEIMVFLWTIEDLQMKTFDPSGDVQELVDALSNPQSLDGKKLVADAEKAFIKVLNTKYNKVKYANYPRGDDGLYDEGLNRYSYAINESIEFVTKDARIRGSFDKSTKWLGSDHDIIAISADDVYLYYHDKDEAI